MVVHRAYRFRLRPSAEQDALLTRFCGCARFVWNKVWALNRDRLAQGGRILWYHEADHWLKLWKKSEDYGFLAEAPSHVLQQKLTDLDGAMRDAFDPEQPDKRLPRFKRRGQDDRIRFPDATQITVERRRIRLPKLGWVQFYGSRPVEGQVKHVTVGREGGRWYVSVNVVTEITVERAPFSVEALDLGTSVFSATASGTLIRPVSPLKRHLRQLARLQRKMARQRKFSADWRKTVARIARLQHHIACVRSDFLQKLSTALVKNHAIVAVEDLPVKSMTASARGTVENPGTNVAAKSGLNRSILDQGWGAFLHMLAYKQDWRMGHLVNVPPAYTSQRCSVCGHVDAANGPERDTFRCQRCGHEAHADVNAARNVLFFGLGKLGLTDGEAQAFVESHAAAGHAASQSPAEGQAGRLPRMQEPWEGTPVPANTTTEAVLVAP